MTKKGGGVDARGASSPPSFGERRKKRRTAPASPYREAAAPASSAVPDGGDDAEVRVGGILSWALPLATVGGAIAMGLLASMGPALLVLLGGAILGAVMLLWGSVRTLTGDAALTPALATAAIRERVTDAQERKRRVLRALKDLEHEHDVGKIDADDFGRLSEEYRAEAKAVMREIDAEIEPRREKAEDFIREHRGDAPETDVSSSAPTKRAPTTEPPPANARACPECGVENDLDADFCKKCGSKMQPDDDDDDDEEPEE